MSAYIVIGPCFSCCKLFTFNPETIPSVPVDPVTNLSPDLGGDPARAVKQPVCADCRRRVNPIRVAKGLEPWPILDDEE